MPVWEVSTCYSEVVYVCDLYNNNMARVEIVLCEAWLAILLESEA